MGLLDGQSQQSYYQGNDHGDYQFTSLTDVISQFMVVYVGEDKLIRNANRTDVAFHAQRAMQELSFDTFKSCKSQEITVPASLQMTLPQDYVNYTKISWVDSAGIKHLLYPTSKTSNPPNPHQNSDGDFTLTFTRVTLSTASSDIVIDDPIPIPTSSPILVGMTITGPYVPAGTFVGSTRTITNITIVTMVDSAGVSVVPTQSSVTNLTFGNSDGSLILPKKSITHLDSDGNPNANLSWNTTDYKITGYSGIISTSIVGMYVSHEFFPVGTIVKSVFGSTIVVDQLPTTAVTSSGEITFWSNADDSDTWDSYKSGTPSENQNQYDDDTYWPMDGSRYGLDPQHAQANGSFYIDDISGKIHFSSNISGKTVILDYISDSLGTDGEMQVHKFAEEAMYKWMSHAILSGKANIPEYQVNRLKKERFAAIRTAKLRLSNLKLEELTQILRGKSKQIKH